MYCKNCGKLIDSNDDYCFECQRDNLIFGTHFTQSSQTSNQKSEEVNKESAPQTQIIPAQTAVINQTYQQEIITPYKKGFGKALTSTIIGTIGYILAIYSFIFSMANIGDNVFSDILNCSYYNVNYELSEIFRNLAVIFFIISTVMAIAGLVLGIISIKHFKHVKNDYGKKLVPTLVLGIVGTVSSGICLYVDLLSGLLLKAAEII